MKHCTGETAKAGVLPKQVTAGKIGVPSVHVGVPFINPVSWAAARPSNSTVQTLLKTRKIGGTLRGLGGEIRDGAKTMKNFQFRVSSVDNNKVLSL